MLYLNKKIRLITHLYNNCLWTLTKIAKKVNCSNTSLCEFKKQNEDKFIDKEIRAELKYEKYLRALAQRTKKNKQRKLNRRSKLWNEGFKIDEIAKRLRISHVGVTAYVGKNRKIDVNRFPYRNDKVWTVELSKTYKK